jgi:hypothetical protein
MRGPLVGLRDEDLLDITAALSADQDGRRRFQLRTSPDEVIDPLAKDILVKLQALHRLSAELTPMQLIAFAIFRKRPTNRAFRISLTRENVCPLTGKLRSTNEDGYGSFQS